MEMMKVGPLIICMTQLVVQNDFRAQERPHFSTTFSIPTRHRNFQGADKTPWVLWHYIGMAGKHLKPERPIPKVIPILELACKP